MRLLRISALVAGLAAAVGVAHLGAGQSQPPDRSSRDLVLTFDDLPYVVVDGQQELSTAQRVTTSIVSVLTKHRAPATAFVNEGKLFISDDSEARIGLLKQWVDAGTTLGNHTYSHADLNQRTVEQFVGEIVKGEVVTRGLMASREPYQLYFRHPETHTGDTAGKKAAVDGFLQSRGYRIAPHTIDSSDFIFNVPYVRALAAQDQAAAARIGAAYVDFVMAATAFAERVSVQIFGRDIPQTILLHANDLNADTLDMLLQRFEARGYRFVTLDAAMTDAAYETRDTFVTNSGPTWLWRWMKSKGQAISFREDPEPPDWISKLYDPR